MKIPFLRDLGNKVKRQHLSFNGLNRRDQKSDEEFSDSLNMTLDYFPLVATRNPRETVGEIAAPQYMFRNGDHVVHIAGAEFIYNGDAKGAITNGKKSIVDFNDKILIFPDKKYYDYIDDDFGDIGTGEYPEEGSCPDIDYATVHSNRVFGVKGNVLYGSSLGHVLTIEDTEADYIEHGWTNFEGVNTDSYAVDVYSEGDFTGIATYQNHVIIFKENVLYELYGNMPSNFQSQLVAKIGCIDYRSIVEVQGVLYFLGKEGMYAFSGGIPKLVSEALNETYISGSAGTDGEKLYLSLETPEGYKLYIYDTKLSIWVKEDDLRVINFSNVISGTYALTEKEELRFDTSPLDFNAGEGEIPWSITTKNFTEESFAKKYTNQFNIKIDIRGFANIYIRYDNEDFSLVRYIEEGKFQTLRIPIRIRRCDSFQIKIEGVGKTKIHQLERVVLIGSDR